jgi:hypothetical protein
VTSLSMTTAKKVFDVIMNFKKNNLRRCFQSTHVLRCNSIWKSRVGRRFNWTKKDFLPAYHTVNWKVNMKCSQSSVSTQTKKKERKKHIKKNWEKSLLIRACIFRLFNETQVTNRVQYGVTKVRLTTNLSCTSEVCLFALVVVILSLIWKRNKNQFVVLFFAQI